MKKTLLGLIALLSISVFAEDYSGDIHKNNYKWMNLSLYHGIDQKGIAGYAKDDTYFETEFGGRSGWLDLYGYVDFVNVFNASDDSWVTDRDKDDNFFAKIAPKFSIDGITKKDLSVGPFKEWYVSTLFNIGDNGYNAAGEGGHGLWQNHIGVGTDVQIPWLGKTSFNLYARHVVEDFDSPAEGKWDGYQLSANWYKPFHEFDNGATLTYQGYFDYVFGADKIGDFDVEDGSFAERSSDNFQTYQGVWYNKDNWAVGYGAKLYHNMNNFKDGGENLAYGENDSSGIAHYFNATYKF